MKIVALIVLLGALLVPSTARAEPVVLMIHGGGYWLNIPISTADMETVDAEGFKPVRVAYKLGDIEAGWQDVCDAAQVYPADRRVYAYGVSAGGGYAAKLATTGLVEASGGLSPLVDLRNPKWAQYGAERFNCSTAECRQKFSPVIEQARQPFKALVPIDDTMVNPADVLGWDARDPLVESVTWRGEHCSPSPLGRDADMRRITRFFATQG